MTKYIVIYETSGTNCWGKRLPVRQSVIVEDTDNEMPFDYAPEQLQDHYVDEIIAIIELPDGVSPYVVIDDKPVTYDAAGGMVGRFDPDATEAE